MAENITKANLGAGIIVCKEGRVLLVQMNYGKFKGHWIIPGGMVEEGEHPEEAALRELKEETNQEAELLGMLAVRHRIYSNLSANVYWVFVGELKKEPLLDLKWPEEEILEARFWKIQDALKDESVRPITREFIEKYSNSKYLNQKYKLSPNEDHSDSAFGI